MITTTTLYFMKIDIIICTFKRPQKVLELVSSLLVFKDQFNGLIVVDSTDEDNIALKDRSDVTYLKSTHKNQPYQRYLGCISSQADFLLYLDDDMELASNKVFSVILDLLAKMPDLSGIAINFEDKHKNSTLDDVPKSLINKNSWFKKIIRKVTAYPILSPGEFGLCGNRGKQPKNGGLTKWLSGGAFVARRNVLFQNFNFQLFDLFEKRMGMGEDAIIGYGLAKRGKLVYCPQLLFYHNDQRDSSYSMDLFAYSKRVTFSRLFLSLEKHRLDNKNSFYPYLHFHWYTFCRITGSLFNFMRNRTSIRKEVLLGSLSGYIYSFTFHLEKLDLSEQKWTNDQ
jgi:glycosyltransferase involved in cell wall biosynthesis